MENVILRNYDTSKYAIDGFLSLVNMILKNNQKNLKNLYELKTLFTNFSLSLKDETYNDIILSSEYYKEIITSIVDVLEQILKFFYENSNKIYFFILF